MFKRFSDLTDNERTVCRLIVKVDGYERSIYFQSMQDLYDYQEMKLEQLVKKGITKYCFTIEDWVEVTHS